MVQTLMATKFGAQPSLRADAEAIHKILWPHFVGLRREHLWRVDLDSRSGFLGAELVSIGTVDMTLAHPREIFSGAIAAGASRIVLAHNHPSGDVRPSAHDEEFFGRIASCGMILGIEVVDQLIIHDERCFSLKAGGRARGSPWARQKHARR